MKKIMFIVILSFLASIIHAQTLDTAIGSAATEVSGRLPRGSTVVMIEFETNSDDLANHVIDEMNHKLVTIGLIRPVERRRLNTVRSELSLNTRGEVGDDFAQRIGHMLGAQHIILGSISSTGNQYVLRFRAITTETANIVWSFSQNIRSDAVLENLLRSSGSRTAAASSGTGSTAQTASQPASAANPAIAIEVTAKSAGTLFFQDREVASLWDNETHTISIERPGTYAVKMVMADHTDTRSVVINTRGITKISFGGVYTVGQPGPAGGIVFFDKGSYSDGWRFLEAASADIAGTAEWGANNKVISRTNTGRGAGKQNTQTIADYLRENGETGRAAQITQEFRQGGYADWFLPSKDELNLMYENLKQKGLGRFQNGVYWSSSEIRNLRAWYQNFNNGEQRGDSITSNDKTTPYFVRAIRQF